MSLTDCPSPMHTNTHKMSCPLLCNPCDQNPFPAPSYVSRTDLMAPPISENQHLFLPAFSHQLTGPYEQATGPTITSLPLGCSQANFGLLLCWVQKGLPVLFSYEHAQYDICAYNLTSLWSVIFFSYLFVCSRGLVLENSPSPTVPFKKAEFHIANKSVKCS